ncbi:MAG: thiamine-phosphate kinase [Gammaproteobacteria bacterium]|nr:thiamine-phosphate kinase [Gammaproteobacteria bacterium]
MPLTEFSLIDRFFAGHKRRGDVALGIGDDAAVVDVPPGEQLVVAVDTLVAGVHFPDHTAAADIGHKALAVNLSDMAAMGACPRWATLALTLPRVDADWLGEFARGFFALAERFDVELIGGDTTRGPLCVSVQILGTVPRNRVLQRAGARAGDRIFVSGSLGDAGLALSLLQTQRACGEDERAELLARLHRPDPRVALGERLRGIASAVIDVSDGLLADLGHILQRSGVGATLWVERLPRSAAFQVCVSAQSPDWFELPLAAGDDYELCFTAAPAQADALQNLARELGIAITEIGAIEADTGLRCRLDDGRAFQPTRQGYEHFD